MHIFRDEKHCDAVIKVEGKEFKIHKSVFALYSDYFDRVFTVEVNNLNSIMINVLVSTL